MKYVTFFLLASFIFSCQLKSEPKTEGTAMDSLQTAELEQSAVIPGADNLAVYLPLLKNKRVGLVINHSSLINGVHLLDTLNALEVSVSRIFTPEHGYTGRADAGEIIEDSNVSEKEIPVVSLYGKKRKPEKEDMEGIDIMVFDMQDVGVRFYTYISTLHFVMESCAEKGIPLLVLDRPNPNGHYVDGPMLREAFRSFVGMHPIPAVYGMTMGELAEMINGEKWLSDALFCDLTVIKNKNYTHLTHYDLPVPPSPNLPDFTAVSLYPSLCFFEGTTVSIGRGTDRPFTVVGHPDMTDMPYSFVPMPNYGAKHPKLEGKTCYGYNLGDISVTNFRARGEIELKWLIEFYNKLKDKGKFFKDSTIDRLAGSDELRKQIVAGKSIEEIRESWQADLKAFKEKRKKYLLYPDFE